MTEHDRQRRRDWPIRVVDLHDPDAASRDRRYWMSRPPEERMAALDRIRFEHDGPQPRLARVARVVRLEDTVDSSNAG